MLDSRGRCLETECMRVVQIDGECGIRIEPLR